jgi:hypothetical protein
MADDLALREAVADIAAWLRAQDPSSHRPLTTGSRMADGCARS